MTRKRLDELLARLQPKLARRFRQVMQRVKDRRTLAELEAALEGGTAGAVLDDIETAAKAFAAQGTAAQALVAGEVAAYLSERLDLLVSYDSTNARAVAALQAHRLRLVQAITEEQRQAIGEVLSGGLAGGINPRQSAIAVRDSIGLDATRARWVANYRRALESADRRAITAYTLRDQRSDRAVQAAIEAGQPLPKARIDKLVDRYAARQLASRAEAIGRTESLRALHAAQDEVYDQAVDAGQLDVDRIQQEWHAGDPPRTRGSHHPMNGQLRRHGVAFRSGDGYELLHPGDPNAPASETVNCRCRKTRRVLPVGQVAVNAGGGYDAKAAA